MNDMDIQHGFRDLGSLALSTANAKTGRADWEVGTGRFDSRELLQRPHGLGKRVCSFADSTRNSPRSKLDGGTMGCATCPKTIRIDHLGKFPCSAQHSSSRRFLNILRSPPRRLLHGSPLLRKFPLLPSDFNGKAADHGFSSANLQIGDGAVWISTVLARSSAKRPRVFLSGECIFAAC